MEFKDLKSVKDAPANYELVEGEQRFIYWYGLFNCKRLKAKKGSEILQILQDQMPNETFDKSQVDFINEISEKEVLAYVCSTHTPRPDIFIYPEDNTPFSIECFI